MYYSTLQKTDTQYKLHRELAKSVVTYWERFQQKVAPNLENGQQYRKVCNVLWSMHNINKYVREMFEFQEAVL